MVKISVYITNAQEEQTFGLSPLMTVTEAVLFIEEQNCKAADFDILSSTVTNRTPAHELLLLSNTSNSNR